MSRVYLGNQLIDTINIGSNAFFAQNQYFAPIDIEYLVVGVGGQGGSFFGGGGGAGGFITGSYNNLPWGGTISVVNAGSRTISSTIPQLNATAYAGGNGGSADSNGANGASGGGGGAPQSFGTPRGGGLSLYSNQGNNGGSGSIGGGPKAAGGGGGAATTGSYETFTYLSVGGRGGDGKQWLDGNYYCAGGGGYGASAGGDGGTGGGGAGGVNFGSNATTFGSGGGGVVFVLLQWRRRRRLLLLLLFL